LVGSADGGSRGARCANRSCAATGQLHTGHSRER
jgi:hypothetical protein